MTKQTMWNNYKAISGAHTYILGFELNKELYMVTRKQVGQFLSYEQASRGQGMGLRLRMKKADKVRLAKKGICLGSIDRLTETAYNKGENFERLVHEHFGQTWEKDHEPFTKCGDIRVDGVEIQIKFDGATFTNEKTLARQKKLAKKA